MKTAITVILTAFVAFLTACHTVQPPAAAPPTVSAAPAQESVGEAGKSVVRAQTAVSNASLSTAQARTLAERIEDKAVVVDKYWEGDR